MTVAGLDALCEMTTPLMHSSRNDGVVHNLYAHSVLSYGVLDVVEVSHACFVHLFLQYAPHTVVSWFKSGDFDATLVAEWILAFLFPATPR